MAQSDARFGYKANLNRQDFDLSQRLGFTSASGMLLPIWCDIATPGDSYYMQHDLPLLRSTVLAQPAMVDVKVHYETFFVPAQMIYQPFENTLFSLKPIQSSNFVIGNLQNNQFPLFDYSTFVSTTLANETTSDYRADAFRLADLFGLNAYNFADANQGGSGVPSKPYKYVPSFFPWQLLTYHSIYEYFFRLDDKSAFQNDFANWDKHYGTTTGITMARDFMMIHQRPWEFDYFTSIYRSPIVSDDNLQSVLPVGQYDDLIIRNIGRVTDTGTQAVNNEDVRAFSPDAFSSYTQAGMFKNTSTAVIRQMYANEKLAMIIGRTKKNYDSQVLAHYGVSVPHDVKHDITLIHHDEYDLNVQEVTSLSASSSDPLGELAGKSYAAGDGKKFKFTAPCHGFIMTIFSIEPKKRYTPAFDRINAIVDAFDLPTPEYDRLGNQPMFRFECGWLSETTPVKDGSDVIGWKERYYWNKRKFDKTTYAFFTPLAGSGGVMNNYAPYMLSFRPFGLNTTNPGSGSEQRPDLEGRFYIERNAVDSLCLIPFAYGWKNTSGGENWSETPWLAYARDPFIVNSFIKCTKVSWMSKDGEPIYNY